MLMLLSPAKSLDYESPLPAVATSVPQALGEADLLMDLLRRKTMGEIATLMDLSPKLAQLNHGRFLAWSVRPKPQLVRPAVLAFNGDVYEGLDAKSLSPDSLQWMQSHALILSGLYGVLRPLDALQPYRLEMGTALENPRGSNLYKFWSQRVTDLISRGLMTHDMQPPWILNLASEEYFKVVDASQISVPIISPVFQDEKAGQFKVISFYAKRARGLMARYATNHQVQHPDQLLSFSAQGYAFDPAHSKPLKPVFRRAGQS